MSKLIEYLYILRDTHNNKTISTHRSLEAAVIAERMFQVAEQMANGANSYVPTTIVDVNGDPVCVEAYWEARHNVGIG